MAATVSTDAPAASAASSAPLRLAALRRSTLFYPLIGLVAVSVLMAMLGDAFLSVGNFANILRQISVVAIIAVGMTFVILSGGIDLSVGAVMALSGTVAAGLMAGGQSAGVGFAAALAIGVGIGAANGALIAFARLPSIIVTLATMGIARGLALIYSGGYPIAARSAGCRPTNTGMRTSLPACWPMMRRSAAFRVVWQSTGERVG